MGVFNTKKNIPGNPTLIPEIAERLCKVFAADGYQVDKAELMCGGADVFITKGGFFKAILGMKTALKINLMPNGSSILFDAGIGIFGQQAIPTFITVFVTWPVLMTQIWGLIQQSQLDDRALAIAEEVVREHGYGTYGHSPSKFCMHCGSRVPSESRFCPSCGKPLY